MIVFGAFLIAAIAELVGSRVGRDVDVVRVVAVFALILAYAATYRLVMQNRFEESATALKAHYEAELARSKDMFVANVSHGIRTPLTGVVGYAHLLHDTLRDAGSREAATVIIGESAELSRMVDDLVTTAHLQTGALSINIEPIPILVEVEKVRDFMDLLRADVSIDIQDVDVLVDRESFAQVMRNLVANAHQHGKTGVTIRGAITNERFVCHVVDQGPGVPTDRHTRLFDRFSSSTYGGAFSGSVGLGLSVAAELMARMGGELSYRRIRGETHFVVSVPVAEEQTSSGQRIVRGPRQESDDTPLAVSS